MFGEIAQKIKGNSGQVIYQPDFLMGDANVTIPNGTRVCFVNTPWTGARTITLPLAATYPPGGRFLYIDPVGNMAFRAPTFARQGSDNIISQDGGNTPGSVTSFTPVTAGGEYRWYSDGKSKWFCDKNGSFYTTQITTAQINAISGTINIGGSNSYVRSNGTAMQLQPLGLAQWGDASNLIVANFDVAIGRNAAGVLEINNSTPGTYRDLNLRYLTAASSAVPGSPVSGQTWNDSTQNILTSFTSGIKQYSVGTIFVATTSTTITNTTSELTAIPTGIGSLTLPANFFVVGKVIEINGGGVFSTTAITAPNITVKIKLGSTVIATVTATNVLAGASSNAFSFDARITCYTTGASGSVMVDGIFSYETGALLARDSAALNNAGVTTTVDTTASKLLDITVTFSAASASNIIKTTTAVAKVVS